MRNLYLSNWLAGYLRWRLERLVEPDHSGTTDVIFLFVDHFECAGKEPRLAQWLTKYPVLAKRHADADGVPPKHTWFYPLDLMDEGELERLRGLVDNGLGEVELHWHHSHDSAEAYERELFAGLETFQRHGFLSPRGSGKPASFAFIHGNWSLNNSRGREFCGVDGEISLLAKAGCYADFTFPALHCPAQPGTVNAIYYATCRDGLAGYDRGPRAQVCGSGAGLLMVFPGPLVINWRDWRFGWHPMFENGEIGRSRSHHDSTRIDSWVRTGIHVKGRPEWVFVKVFCHGGQDHDAVLGAETDAMFSRLEEAYNDGGRYRLHYVTAREAYNIVKAAEDGNSGNPNDFRDYLIPAS